MNLEEASVHLSRMEVSLKCDTWKMKIASWVSREFIVDSRTRRTYPMPRQGAYSEEPCMIGPIFTLRSADHTTWFGNVYDVLHVSSILLHLSELVIPFMYSMHLEHRILTPSNIRPACQSMGYHAPWTGTRNFVKAVTHTTCELRALQAI